MLMSTRRVAGIPDIKEDWSYTSCRINIQHNKVNLSKRYLSFQP
jgi:hypothetical protein